MADSIKGTLPPSINILTNKDPINQTSNNGQNFGDFLKTDLKDFVGKSNQVEGLLSNYIQGFGDIEEIAPKFKEIMLEFELKTKIVSSLANMLKTLTSMQI